MAQSTGSSAENTGVSKKETPQNGIKKKWGRYYGIIVSGLLFLLLDSSVFLFNIYISQEVEERGIRVNIASRQSSLIQQVSKVLLQIQHRLEQGQSIEAPLKELEQASITFDDVLVAFKEGNVVPDGSEQPVYMSPCETRIELMLVNNVAQLWSPLKVELDLILQNGEKIRLEDLSQAIQLALKHNREISKLMNNLAFEIEEIAENEIEELKLIQSGGIVLALLNFVFLLAHFVNRLAEKDKELNQYSQDLETKIDSRTKELEEQKLKLAGYSQGLEHLVETKTRELKESEEKYRTIFESFPDIYYRSDMMGNITVVSPSVQFLTGFSLAEVKGQPAKILFNNEQTFDDMIDIIKEKNSIHRHEMEVRVKGGGVRAMTVTARLLFHESLPIGFEAVLHDVTEQKEAAKKLSALNDELLSANTSLKKALALKKEFLAVASHDLKNPISAIQGVAKLMEMEGGLSDSQLENVDMVKSTATYTLELIEQLVTNAMLDDDNVKITRTEFDLGVLTDEVININKANAQHKGQRFDLTVPKHVMVFADRHKIREALDNLISNAVKYSPFEETIQIGLQQHAETVVFKVKDNGPGLTADDKKKVFGKFQKLSASPTGEESSSGLGLSIVKRILELHNGKVWVESEPGEGATFCFELPLAN